MATIKFGTDGWRARIAEDFTYANVEIVTQAVAQYVKSQTPTGPWRLLVGFDRRFASEWFAARVAEVLAGNGIAADLMKHDAPTPQISFEVKSRGLDGGVIITASHNPPDFNGYKFKAPYGGAATPKITGEIESFLNTESPRRTYLAEGISSGVITLLDPSEGYRKHLEEFVDTDRLKSATGLVIADPMHGTGGRWIEELLSGGKLRVETIRANRDPLFGGVFPEPMPQHLDALKVAIRERGALIGLVTDGDADRIGAMDERGEYINTHQILCLLLLHMVRNRGQSGSVARTFSQSVLIRRIATSYGFRLFETPVGFKHIGDLMLDPANDLLIGGEESGGIGVRGHIPERDGILNALLLLEAVLTAGKTPSQLVRDLWAEFGEFHFERRDLHVPISAGEKLVSRLRVETPTRFAGFEVDHIETLDGTKLVFNDDSWILFRQSGTEPLLRVYCEATSQQKMKTMIDEGERLAKS